MAFLDETGLKQFKSKLDDTFVKKTAVGTAASFNTVNISSKAFAGRIPYIDNGGGEHTSAAVYFHKEGSTKSYDMVLLCDNGGNAYLNPPLSTWSGGTGATDIDSARVNLGINSGSSVPGSGSNKNIFIQV